MSVSLKILIVDDQLFVREALAGLLANADSDLFFAENGDQALQLAQEIQPDIILLDIMLPDLDGYEVCRRIRADPALAETAVIMITALDDRNSRLAGLLAGADDFLTKPLDSFELQVRIKNITRLNRYRNLVAERSRFNWVVENNDKGYLILNEQRQIQYANQRAQVYFHLPEDYININFDQQAARYYQSHSTEDENDASTSVSTTYLVQPESATARAFWLSMEELHTPFNLENQHLLRVDDITEDMSARQDIRKMHLLVAHKLRTPVSLIYSSMNLLNMKMDAVPEKDVKAMVRIAWQSSERLVKDVHDILEYINAPINLANGAPLILDNLREMLFNAAKALEIDSVFVSIPDQLANRKLKISTTAMEMIVYEILENSKKFHPREAPHIHVRVELHGEKDVRIQFLDDGQTMTAEQIGLAQLPYSQGEKWFTGEAPGMGLGIPLVSTLVWQAGGQIRIENRSDQTGVSVGLNLRTLSA